MAIKGGFHEHERGGSIADLVGGVLQDLGAPEDDVGPVAAHRQPLLRVPHVARRLPPPQKKGARVAGKGNKAYLLCCALPYCAA